VTWSIPQGAVVGLMGTNGAGKTTLIRCLLGLLRYDAGEIRLFGEEPWDLSEATKGRIGYVPQVVYLYRWMRVKHVIKYTASFYPTWDHAWVDELINRWHVPLDDRVATLSTGQLQTLEIVLALGHRPELLVLDEPVASLDPLARRDFLRSLIELTQDGSRTVLFSTHISSDLERVASHVAMLRHGKVDHFREIDELKDRVKRLRLIGDKPLPASFAVPGALRTRIDGASALVAVSDVEDTLIADLKARWDVAVEVEDLNLEEIFVELNG
jgi:ABC-2 type transport system ATP-binding protein